MVANLIQLFQLCPCKDADVCRESKHVTQFGQRPESAVEKTPEFAGSPFCGTFYDVCGGRKSCPPCL